jgi:hypothetical protein
MSANLTPFFQARQVEGVAERAVERLFRVNTPPPPVRPARPAHDGIYRLLAALLDDAIARATGARHGAVRDQVQARTEARFWIASGNRGPITFREACEALDLDAERIREAVLGRRGGRR